MARAFGEEDQPAEIGAGAQHRIGGGGRVDPADFDLDRHGMGLYGPAGPKSSKPEPLGP